MKICLIGKYPPIAGGVAAQTYWLARGLGQKGHQVHIVTNNLLVEDTYRQALDLTNRLDLAQYRPANVHIHSLAEKSPFHIPYTDAAVTRLANLAIQVIGKYRCELIESVYMLPYAVAGYLAKAFTGRCQIIKTAGSDVNLLFKQDGFRSIFLNIFKNADSVVTSSSFGEELSNLGVAPDKIFPAPLAAVPADYFNPKVKPVNLEEIGIADVKVDTLVLLIACKTHRSKGIFELVQALERIKEDYLALFITNGRDMTEFMAHLNRHSNARARSKVIGFQPPWKMPGLIRRASCVIQIERQFPVKRHQPKLPRESLASGVCTLISQELAGNMPFKDGLKNGYNTVIVNPSDINQLASKLREIIMNKKLTAAVGLNGYRSLKERITDFAGYVDKRLEIYEKTLSGRPGKPLDNSLLPKSLKMF
ncbi:MAG TPA: glycosyltransferase [Planctomycetota bacterium]|nr:glycosyltransferase [Planctomycetota bacterium]